MEDKEIIIDGKKEKVNILFECNHIDDLQAYEMIKNRIEITPENAPICNFKIKIVSNTKSPYGFYTIFQKDPKKDEWEYMGIGNSGASSLITALLKIHKMGLKRISDLEERIIKHSDEIEEYCNRLADKDHELKTLCKAFEIECLKNTKTGEVTYRSDKLLRKEQECEELEKTISDFISDNRSMYCYDDRQPVTLEEMQECMEFTYNAGLKYKQTLETIEKECKFVIDNRECYDLRETDRCELFLNLINKAKENNQ